MITINKITNRKIKNLKNKNESNIVKINRKNNLKNKIKKLK